MPSWVINDLETMRKEVVVTYLEVLSRYSYFPAEVEEMHEKKVNLHSQYFDWDPNRASLQYGAETLSFQPTCSMKKQEKHWKLVSLT
jgi:hypothetical protein